MRTLNTLLEREVRVTVSGEIVDRGLFITTCEGGKEWPFEERCSSCRHCREIKVIAHGSLVVSRQNLYLGYGEKRIVFDQPEEFADDFPALGRSVLVNQRGIKELVCTAGRDPVKVETYVDGFRPPLETGSCWQQSRPEEIGKLCANCGTDLQAQGALIIPPSYKGRLATRNGGFTFEAVIECDSPPLTENAVNCAGCYATLFTQDHIPIRGSD